MSVWQICIGVNGYTSLMSEGGSESISPNTVAIVVDETPRGEWSEWTKFGDTDRRRRDMIRTVLIVRDCTITKENHLPKGEHKFGQLVSKVVKNYYADMNSVQEQSDFCCYCGTDNGPNGENRNGWDCCGCGGN